MAFQRKDFRREATISIACVGALIAIVVGFAVRDVWRAHNGALAGGRDGLPSWRSSRRADTTFRSGDRPLIVRYRRNAAAIARHAGP